MFSLSTHRSHLCENGRTMDELEAREQFARWLTNQMEGRNLTARALSRLIERKTGHDVSGAAIGSWKSGERHISATSCRLLAQALDLDPNEVLRQAGRHGDILVTGEASARAEQGQAATAAANVAHNADDEVLVYTMYDLLQRTSLSDAAKEHVRQTIEYVRKRDQDIEDGMA